MAIEVHVERDRCIGVKSCVAAAPGTFVIDSRGKSTVLNPEGDPESALVDAAGSCPTGAISVFKDGIRIA